MSLTVALQLGLENYQKASFAIKKCLQARLTLCKAEVSCKIEYSGPT